MIQLLIKLILPEPVTIVNTDSSCKPLKCWEKVSDLINSLRYHLWASEQFNQIYFILFWSLLTTSIVILTRHLCDFDWQSEYTKFPSEEYKSHIPWGQWFEYHNNLNFPCSSYSFISLHNFLIGNFCHIILLMQNFWHGSAFYFSNVVTCVTWEDINEYFKWLIGPPRLLFSSFHISQYNHNFTQVFTLNLSFVASSYKNIVEDSRKYLEER